MILKIIPQGPAEQGSDEQPGQAGQVAEAVEHEVRRQLVPLFDEARLEGVAVRVVCVDDDPAKTRRRRQDHHARNAQQDYPGHLKKILPWAREKCVRKFLRNDQWTSDQRL